MCDFIETIPIGLVPTNCYLLNDEDEVVIVDPASDAPILEQKIRDRSQNPHLTILLTHGHWDHIVALKEIADRFPEALIFMGVGDLDYLSNSHLNRSEFRNLNVTATGLDDRLQFVSDGDAIFIGKYVIRTLSTPGHTPGSVTYVFDKEKVAFVGDTLFFEQKGRSDFERGCAEDLEHSMKEKVLKLPDDIICLPGHYQSTTIGHERPLYN